LINAGSVYILIAIFLWSSQGIFIRFSGVEVHTLIFCSLVVALLIQAVLLSGRRYRKSMPAFRELGYPLVLGLISLVNTFTFYYAYKNTTIANAVLTHYTAPVIVAFLAPFLLKERVTIRIVSVIVMASAGLWIMLKGFSLQGAHTSGILAGLISGFSYAAIIIFIRKYARGYHPLILAFYTNIFMAVMLVPFIREIPVSAWWGYLSMGTVHSTIAPILYYKGLQSVTANRAAVLGYLEPVCAILFSMLFLYEVPGINSLIGGVIIILSGYLTLRDPKA
jgi:drug/metabolite transporter (DMT)-like permease